MVRSSWIVLLYNFQSDFARFILWALLLSCFGVLQQRPVQAAPTPVQSAPIFTLKDTQGKTHSLREFRQKPVALFFFCGCDPCHRFASLWAQASLDCYPFSQLGSRTASPVQFISPLPTLIVYSGDGASAHAFMAEAGLNPQTTTLLLDPKEQVADTYNVTLCPRVFLIDPTGQVRYTNNERGTDPQITSAVVAVSRVLAIARSFKPTTPLRSVKVKHHV